MPPTPLSNEWITVVIGIPAATARASEVTSSVITGLSFTTAIKKMSPTTETTAAESRKMLCESMPNIASALVQSILLRPGNISGCPILNAFFAFRVGNNDTQLGPDRKKPTIY